jgi:hypothetical protein
MCELLGDNVMMNLKTETKVAELREVIQIHHYKKQY